MKQRRLPLFGHVRSETKEGVLRLERNTGRMDNALQAIDR